MSIRTEETHHSGPLPRPEDLQAYDDACPGCAEIIVHEMQAQGRHRRFLEKVAVIADVVRAQLGQFCGFALAGFMVWEGAGLLRAGESANGFEAIGIGIASVIAPFLYKQYQERKERQENIQRLKK